MSTSTTTNLRLILDNADEPVKTHHRHANENLATLDVTIKSLQDSMDNAKELLGQLGIDANDHYVVDAETARTTLGVPSSSDIADIVRQNIPLMSPTTLGGAKLDEHGGLVLRDEKLGIGSLVRESDGAVRGGIAGLTAEGHAEQVSTTGKNLAKPFQNPTSPYSYAGVTWTHLGDGVWSASGTSPSAGMAASQYQTHDLGVLSAGTYVASMRVVSGTVSGMGLFATLRKGDSGATGVSIIGVSSGGDVVGTVTADGTTHYWIQMGVRENTTVTNLVLTVQLELGSTATEYEPYTGGAPSPSPEFPQTIEVVRGRNLLPNTASSTTINGVTFTKNADGSVTANGTAGTISGYANFIVSTASSMPFIGQGVTLTLSGCPAGGGENAYAIFAELNDGSTAKMLKDFGSGSTVTYADARPTGAGNIYIRIKQGVTVNNLVFKPQLTLGSTPQPYVPYGHVGLEVQGRNLLPNTATSQTVDGVTFTVNADGSVTANGTCGSVAEIMYLYTDVLDAGSYMVSGCPAGGTDGSSYRIRIGKRDGTFIANEKGNGELITISTPQIIQIQLVIQAGYVAKNLTFYPMVEAGTKKTPYEPYFHSTTPIPLPPRGWVGSLPDGTADVLTLDGAGKVTWEESTEEVGFDGSSDENWVMENNGRRVRITNYGPKAKPTPDNGTIANGYSSHFPAVTPSQTWNMTKAGFSYESIPTRMGLFFNDGSGSMTVESWKTWLASNPVTLLYPLATTVTEDCGYINMPAIEGDCTISIPELDALGVKYFVDDSAGTLAKQWYDREVNESDESLAQSIAMIESTTAQSNHAVNSYFMLDNVLRKATSAIASGETITDSNSSPITVEQVMTALNNSVAALEKEVVFAITPSVSHRNIYRGKNLGTVLTTAQKAQIAAGTFDDLYVGDYWTINGRVYRIADIDYYYNSGDTAFTKHHLVIVPDASFGNNKMNDTNITTGAYKGSKMYTDSSSVLNTARATIANDFGSALATHRIYLQNAVTNGYASAGEWTDSTVDLMNEPMVYGSYIYTPAGNGSIVPNRYTVEKSQLALFRLNHRMINPGRYSYWLRDVVSAAYFAFVNYGGVANSADASASVGVRPDFCIVGN